MILQKFEDLGLEVYPYDPEDRETWLDQRIQISGADPSDDHCRFGGSDTGSILDLNEWQGPHALYYERLGIKSPNDEINPHMFRGINLEEIIAMKYFPYHDLDDEQTAKLISNWREGKIIRTCSPVHATIINPDYKHLFMNLDFWIDENPHTREGVLEIKSMYGTGLDKWEGGIPPYQVVQLQTYLMGTKSDYGEVYILKDATTPERFPFEANKEVQQNIIDATTDFAERILNARKEIKAMENPEDEDAFWEIVYKYEPPKSEEPAYLKFLKGPYHPDRPDIVDYKDLKEEELTAFLRGAGIKEDLSKLTKDWQVQEALIRKAMIDHRAEKIKFPDGASVGWKSKLLGNWDKISKL